MTQDLVAYLISRNDLTSMTHGKELAQAHHAGVQMAVHLAKNQQFQEYIAAGTAAGADAFNVTIALAADVHMITHAVHLAQELGYAAGLVQDPSYPYACPSEIAWAHGKVAFLPKTPTVMLTREEITMGWLFGDRQDHVFVALVANMPLKSHNTLIYRKNT